MSDARTRVARSVATGFMAAALLGALGLGLAALLRLNVSCEGLGAADCQLEHELARELGRLQGLAALGLAALAGGLWLFRR